MSDRIELAQNAAGRMVPTMVNGKPQIPYLGAGKYQPHGRKGAPPVHSNKDYPQNGDKRVANIETALRKCGLLNFVMEFADFLNDMLVKLAFDELAGHPDGVLYRLGRTGSVRLDTNAIDTEQHSAAVLVGIDFALERPATF